jgi:hypothetical protein
MTLQFPLVQFYDEGWRTGHLIRVAGEVGYIQPIGARGGTVPSKVRCRLSDLKLLEGQDLSLAPRAEPELEGTKTSNKKKREAYKVITLTKKAPETEALKAGSHAYAVLSGIRQLGGRAHRAELLDLIRGQKLVKTQMDESKALSWTIWQLIGKGYLKTEKEGL